MSSTCRAFALCFTVLCCACATSAPARSAAVDAVADVGSLDVVDTYTPAGPDTMCTDVCGVIPPGGTCGGCCMQCTQGSTCIGGFCKCPASGCTSDAWDGGVTGDVAEPQCATPTFDPDCGPCQMELAMWCGKNNKRCFCGEQSCGDTTVLYSTGGACPTGTVCVGGGSGYGATGAQCEPACNDECDPSQQPACYGSALVECVTGGACAKVQTVACPSGKCVAGACQ